MKHKLVRIAGRAGLIVLLFAFFQLRIAAGAFLRTAEEHPIPIIPAGQGREAHRRVPAGAGAANRRNRFSYFLSGSWVRPWIFEFHGE